MEHTQERAAIDDTLRHPHLRTLAAEAQQNEEAVHSLAATLAPRQLAWKPDAHTWSVAECIEHLVVIGRAYYPRIAEGFRRAPAQPPALAPPFRPTWLGRIFYQIVRADRRWKVPAPLAFRPRGHVPPSSAEATGAEGGERFMRQQQALFELIQQAEGRDLRARFASPLLRWLRFSVGEGLWLIVEHQKRHINQARALLTHPSFPSE